MLENWPERKLRASIESLPREFRASVGNSVAQLSRDIEKCSSKLTEEWGRLGSQLSTDVRHVQSSVIQLGDDLARQWDSGTDRIVSSLSVLTDQLGAEIREVRHQLELSNYYLEEILDAIRHPLRSEANDHFEQGLKHYYVIPKGKRLKKAMENFHKAEDDNTACHMIGLYLARCYEMLGDNAKEDEYFDFSVDMAEGAVIRAGVRYEYALRLRERGEFDLAEEHLEKAIEEAPINIESGLGPFHRKATVYHPTVSDCLYARGVVRILRGNVNEGITDLQVAILDDPRLFGYAPIDKNLQSSARAYNAILRLLDKLLDCVLGRIDAARSIIEPIVVMIESIECPDYAYRDKYVNEYRAAVALVGPKFGYANLVRTAGFLKGLLYEDPWSVLVTNLKAYKKHLSEGCNRMANSLECQANARIREQERLLAERKKKAQEIKNKAKGPMVGFGCFTYLTVGASVGVLSEIDNNLTAGTIFEGMIWLMITAVPAVVFLCIALSYRSRARDINTSRYEPELDTEYRRLQGRRSIIESYFSISEIEIDRLTSAAERHVLTPPLDLPAHQPPGSNSRGV
jgi:tetratricopeptide (TPR) repeat protein